jgi:hypothetical protein
MVKSSKGIGFSKLVEADLKAMTARPGARPETTE